MIQQINIQSIPNQNFKYQTDAELYDITIKTTDKATFISINRDDTIIVSNQILIPNKLIIGYDYLTTNGNFTLSTLNNNLPDYTKFNVSQFFYYVPNEELTQ